MMSATRRADRSPSLCKPHLDRARGRTRSCIRSGKRGYALAERYLATVGALELRVAAPRRGWCSRIWLSAPPCSWGTRRGHVGASYRRSARSRSGQRRRRSTDSARSRPAATRTRPTRHMPVRARRLHWALLQASKCATYEITVHGRTATGKGMVEAYHLRSLMEGSDPISGLTVVGGVGGAGRSRRSTSRSRHRSRCRSCGR